MNKSLLTDAERQVLAARIQRNYDYSPTAGLLINRRRNRLVKGVTRGKDRYKSTQLFISGKSVNLTYHHVVWVWHKGYWPTQLDHINGDEADNRIENLREVTQSENNLNREYPWRPNTDTGLPGVFNNNGSFTGKVGGRKITNPDPYKVFFFTIILGKKYV
jgi:hypothetical protein